MEDHGKHCYVGACEQALLAAKEVLFRQLGLPLGRVLAGSPTDLQIY